MIIKGYGTKLSRLTHNDIEMVRNWRNSETVRPFMEFQEHITTEMQEKWFASIDNEAHNYYIIFDGDEKIGLIYGSYINWVKKETSNGGIFISNPEYWQTAIPLTATFLLMDISFMLGLERTFIKVLKTNKNAIQFNNNVGYEILEGQENILNQKYVLTQETYEKKTKNIREKLKKIYTDKIEIIINNPTHVVSKMALESYKTQPEEIKNRVSLSIDINYF